MLLKSVQRFAIYLLNPGGHVTTWNPAAQTIKGYSLHEVLERYFSIFYAPEDRAAGEPEREIISATSGVYSTEGWRVRKDGQRFWANVTLTALFNDSGELRGFAKVTRDMTEYRRAQEERIRLERAEEALRFPDQFLHEDLSALSGVGLCAAAQGGARLQPLLRRLARVYGAAPDHGLSVFEREVTGERIRDKIAASRWCPPPLRSYLRVRPRGVSCGQPPGGKN
jgi:PAS domain S-box-containing protein